MCKLSHESPRISDGVGKSNYPVIWMGHGWAAFASLSPLSVASFQMPLSSVSIPEQKGLQLYTPVALRDSDSTMETRVQAHDQTRTVYTIQSLLPFASSDVMIKAHGKPLTLYSRMFRQL